MNTQLQRGFRTSIPPNNNPGVWVRLPLHAAVVPRFILPLMLKRLNIWKFDLGIKARKKWHSVFLEVTLSDCFSGNLRLVFGREQKNPVLLYNNFLRKAFVTWQEGGVLLSRQITMATRPLCTPPCAPRQTCAVQDKCVPNTGSKLKYFFKFRLKTTQYMKYYRIDSLDRQTNFSFQFEFL